MNYRSAVLAIGILGAAGLAGAASLDAVAGLANGPTAQDASSGASSSSSSGSSSSASSVKFTGRNGKVAVDGDLVQARDGVLTVNGISYGTVGDKSVVQYVVRDGERTLTVDGVPRQPAR